MTEQENICPVTQDPIKIQELAPGKGRSILCRVHTRFWTSKVFDSKSQATRWINEVCLDSETFLDGAEAYAKELVLSPSPDPRTFFFIRNPKHGWSSTVRGTTEKEVWFALTNRPDFAPPKVEVIRDETDFVHRLDDTFDDMKSEFDNMEVDELLEYAKEKKKEAESNG
jgi:hypothetical protein